MRGEMGSSPLCDDTPVSHARESFIYASFVLWLAGQLTSSIPGREICKPSTYMAYVYAVRRHHTRHFKLFQCPGAA